MSRSWSYYGEFTSGLGFRRMTAHEELLTLWTHDAYVIDDLRSLFEEAATDTLANVLGDAEARALVLMIGTKNFRNPRRLYRALDSIFPDGGEVLKEAVAREFRASVHLLWGKMRRESVRDAEVLRPSLSRVSKNHRLP